MRHVGPGSEVPTWIEALDRACFKEAWGPLEETEHLWALEGQGFARWRVIPAAGQAELLRIAVSPLARRAGVARRLLRASEEDLARMGVEALDLEVRVSNEGARRLYESEGWVRTGLRKAYYRDGEDAALYARTLTGPRP
jgi:ribosomal-protein-alanine N-acetyltransferase